jgi:hypothetical protein
MECMMKAETICAALLVLIIAGHLAADAAWQSRNIGPDFWDPASYLVLSELMYAKCGQGGLEALGDAFLNIDRKRAPLVPMMYAGTYALTGNDRSSAHIVNHLALVVLCLSVYGIGRQLAGPWCALAAAWVTMMLPMMFGLSRQLFVEFPLCAAVAAFVYLCLASDGFRRHGIAVLLGLVLGIGLMIKISFPVFAAGPVLAVLLAALFRKGRPASLLGLLASFAITVFFAALIAGPWYVWNASAWTEYLKANTSGYYGALFGGSIPEYLESQAGLSLFYVQAVILAALIIARVVFRGRTRIAAPPDARERRGALLAVGLWFAVPLAAGVLSLVKDPRLIAPAFPAMGLLLAYAYVRLTPRRLWPLTAALLLLMAAPFYGVSFGGSFSMPQKGQFDVSFAKTFQPWSASDGAFLSPRSGPDFWPKYFLGRWNASFLACRPVTQDWKSADVMSVIDAQLPDRADEERRVSIMAVLAGQGGGVVYTDTSKLKQVPAVVVLTDHPCFEAIWFSYLNWRREAEGARAKMEVDYMGMPTLERDTSFEKLCDKALLAYFVVAKDSGWQGPEATTRWLDRLMYAVKESGLFEKVDCDISLPDGSKVLIYRQAGAAVIAPAEYNRVLKLMEDFRRLARDYGGTPP